MENDDVVSQLGGIANLSSQILLEARLAIIVVAIR